MSKKILAIAIMMIMLILTGCTGGTNGGGTNAGGTGDGGHQNRGDGYTLKAIVKSVSRDSIEVEVIESDYAFGIYWVRTGDQTSYCNRDGTSATRDDIKAGQTVLIVYSGQVMMSYPPQIVAWSITVQ